MPPFIVRAQNNKKNKNFNKVRPSCGMKDPYFLNDKALAHKGATLIEICEKKTRAL
jgi:hypothetical protein